MSFMVVLLFVLSIISALKPEMTVHFALEPVSVSDRQKRRNCVLQLVSLLVANCLAAGGLGICEDGKRCCIIHDLVPLSHKNPRGFLSAFCSGSWYGSESSTNR